MIKSRDENKLDIDQLIVLIYIFATLFIDVLRKMHFLESRMELLRNGIYIFCFMYIIYRIYQYKYIAFDIILLLILFPMQAIVTWFKEPSLTKVILHFVLFYISRCFTGYYLFSRVNLESTIKRFMPLFAIIAILYSFTLLNYGFDKETYMASSYNLVLSTSFLVIEAISNLNLIYFLSGFFSLTTIIIVGARGALVAVGTAIALFMAFYLIEGHMTKKKGYVILLIVSLAIIFSTNSKTILAILGSKGTISRSRTLSILFSGNITFGGQRSNIYSALMNKIAENPISYRGILTDRIVGARELLTEPGTGTYAHNVILEILYQNGIIIGGIILTVFFTILLSAFRYVIVSRDMAKAMLMFVLFSVGFVTMLFSNSYLISYMFWMFLGRCVYEIRVGRNAETEDMLLQYE